MGAPAAERGALGYPPADVWWGALLTVFGPVYILKFRPSKHAGLTGS